MRGCSDACDCSPTPFRVPFSPGVSPFDSFSLNLTLLSTSSEVAEVRGQLLSAQTPSAAPTTGVLPLQMLRWKPNST